MHACMHAVDRIAAPDSSLTCVPLCHVTPQSNGTGDIPTGVDFGRGRVTCLSQWDVGGSDGQAILS